MTETCPTPEDAARDLIGEARRLASGLVAFLVNQMHEAPPAPASAPADPAQFNARFGLRLFALRAACADPEACARRLLRRLARQRPAARPLKSAPPPGITQARTDHIKDLFAKLETATCQAWTRLADTS